MTAESDKNKLKNTLLAMIKAMPENTQAELFDELVARGLIKKAGVKK